MSEREGRWCPACMEAKRDGKSERGNDGGGED